MSAEAAYLDRYLPGASALHGADARAKAPMTVGFILATSALPVGAWAWYGVMCAAVWLAVAASGVGLRRLAGRTLIALPFVLAAVPAIFTRPGQPVGELPLGPWSLTAIDAGLVFCGSVLLKSWISVTAASLLVATTPATTLITALYALRVPPVLVRIVAFMHRYLFLLTEEVARLLRARASRSAALDGPVGGSVAWRARVAGGMAGALFIRTYDRAERIHMTMLARGFDGDFRQRAPVPLSRASLTGAAAVLVACGGVVALAHMSAWL